MNTSNQDTLLLLKKPEVKKRLVELRDSNEYSNWEEIRMKFNQEFESNVSMTAIKNTYNKTMATSITVSGNDTQQFNGLIEGMAKRLNRMQVVTDKMIFQIEKALELFESSDELTDLKKAEMILELAPKIDKMNSSVIKQLNFLNTQLKQITIKQESMVWDDNRVKNEMDKLQPLRLQILEEDGKIAIIDRSLLDEN